MKKKLITRDETDFISNWVLENLTDHAASVGTDKITSSNTRKEVSKWVSKQVAEENESFLNIPTFLAAQVFAYAQRIRIYPLITRYREPILESTQDMVYAWQLHSHSLRQNELYIIQERGSALLELAHSIALDMGLATKSQSKKFERKYKSHFERRLRDRHRVVHAHEEPSFISKLLDLAIISSDKASDKERFLDVAVESSLEMAMKTLGRDASDINKLKELVQSVPIKFVEMAEAEAVSMYEMFFEALKETIPTSRQK